MYTPADQTFAMLMPSSATLFFVWHCWHYDRLQCLIPTKKDWFRALMCQLILWSALLLCVWAIIQMSVAYTEYYVYIGETIPAPSQLWSPNSIKLEKISNCFLAIGWAILQAIHLEEFVYWGYLITSINTPGGHSRSWINSNFFRGWVVCSFSALAIIIGALCMETNNVDRMKANVMIVGSCLSMAMAIASLSLCAMIPPFIDKIRRQGAPIDVIERMLFFQEMNELRTGFRAIYAICFLILSADALTPSQTINKSNFWCDFLYLTAVFGIFASYCLSLIILLPRNMSTESLPENADKKALDMTTYRRPTMVGGMNFPMSQRQFHELGERLNVHPEIMANSFAAWEMTSQNGKPKYEEDFMSPGQVGGDGDIERPFAATADRSKKARLSEMSTLPSVVRKFRSPLETAPISQVGPARVLVTSHTVVEEE